MLFCLIRKPHQSLKPKHRNQHQPELSHLQQMDRKEEVKLGGAAVSLSADLSSLQGSGGAEREAALASLEKQLICPICLEIFNKPVVILPCEHNLCRKCANELYQPSLFHARTTMLVNSGRFRCPSCRHEVVLDRHGVYGLQRNLLVENIIDIYKQEVSNTSPLPAPPPPTQVMCADHEGEKVNIYCLTCQVPTCSLCKVFGAHQSCQVAPLSDVYQQQKDQLSDGVASLMAFSDKIQSLINELEETCRNIEENCRTQKQNVCEKFNHMFSILEERQKAMTQRISSEQEEKTGHTRVLVRCYGDSMAANSKLVESAMSSMEEPDMAAFVQNSRELITKVKVASTSGPSEMLKPGYENLSHYRFNFIEQENALKSIDFIKGVEDVPEEPQLDPEPEEHKEPLIQDTEPKQSHETSIQNQEAAVEAERIPALINPVEPVQTAAVGPAGEVSQLETPELDSGHIEEEEEEVEEEAARDPVKKASERQEGMSTQQGGEAAGEEQDMDAAFYPGWCTVSSAPSAAEETLTEVYDAELRMGSPQIPKDSPLEDKRAVEPQIQLQPPRIQDSQLPDPESPHLSELLLQPQHLPPPSQFPDFPESHPLSFLEASPSALISVPPVPIHQQAAGEPQEESEEEEDVQGWMCLPKEHLKADGVSERKGSSSLVPPDLGEGKFELSNAEQEEDNVGVSVLAEGVLETETMKEELERGRAGCGWEEDAEESRNKRRDGEFNASNGREEDEKKHEGSSITVETGGAEGVSPQAVTLLFYLLALLVILQRAWAYIGCFICT